MSRVFLNARKLRTPAIARANTTIALMDWQDELIRTALGQSFRVRGRVVLRRPRWMPARLYTALLRSILVERKVEERR